LLRFSALARLVELPKANDRSVTATLQAVRGLPFGVLVCGVATPPQDVLWQGKPVPKREKLERHELGWRHVTERGWLLINLAGTGNGTELVVRLGK